MPTMDDLSSLQQQVVFRERWRGYDPNEVDAYVERVLAVVARAQEQTGTAQQLVDEGESRADAPVAPDDSSDAHESSGTIAAHPETDLTQTSEGLARTLALAQSAADKAVAEAQQQAEQMVSAAQTQVAEAKSEAETLLSSARSEASKVRSEADEYAESTIAYVENLAKEREIAAATAEREKYASEIAELSAQRALLSEDLELLDQHLVEQRHQIEQSLATLTNLVTSPETFRTSKAPLTKAAETSFEVASHTEVLDALDDENEVVEDDENKVPDDLGDLGDSGESTVRPDNGDDHQYQGSNDQGQGDAVPETTIDPDYQQPRYVTVADLEEPGAFDEPLDDLKHEANDSPVSQLFDDEEPLAATTKADEEPFLTQLREAAAADDRQIPSDDAMSAFFNQDEEQRKSPWFLGGR